MTTPNDLAELDFARAVLRAEAEAVAGMAATLPPGFADAVGILVRCAEAGGTVLVSGLGKSGLVGAKLSATLASLGIASHPVHPTEAAHGDLGRFRPADAVIALSYSGETAELVALAGILRQDGIPIVSITGGDIERASSSPSSLERLATVALRMGRLVEAGGDDYVAPTSSTTAAMALGDALALAAARRRGFTKADFARRHPGGALGGQLRPVVEAMRFRVGVNLPVVADSLTVLAALQEAAKVGRRPGALLLADSVTGRLAGILTDGDVRRLVLKDRAELDRPVRDVMTKAPRTLRASAVLRDAVAMVREFRQDEIPVVDDSGKPLGILDVQDLVAMKLVQEE